MSTSATGARRSISSSAISARPTASPGPAARAISCAGRWRRWRRSPACRLYAAFEQEFVYTGVEELPGAPYSLDAYRRQGIFGEAFTAALRQAGVTPDSFLPEYGARQFEVTCRRPSASERPTMR